jgi:hypothetical protein
LIYQKQKAMTTITNTTGTKAVNVYQNHDGNFRALYVQIYKGDQQVLQVKEFKRKTSAQKWANKILN